MKSNILSQEEYLKNNNLDNYCIEDKKEILLKFRGELKEYKKAINLKLESRVTSDLEEHCKKLFNKLLESVYNYSINTQGRIDSVVFEQN